MLNYLFSRNIWTHFCYTHDFKVVLLHDSLRRSSFLQILLIKSRCIIRLKFRRASPESCISGIQCCLCRFGIGVNAAPPSSCSNTTGSVCLCVCSTHSSQVFVEFPRDVRVNRQMLGPRELWETNSATFLHPPPKKKNCLQSASNQIYKVLMCVKVSRWTVFQGKHSMGFLKITTMLSLSLKLQVRCDALQLLFSFFCRLKCWVPLVNHPTLTVTKRCGRAAV